MFILPKITKLQFSEFMPFIFMPFIFLEMLNLQRCRCLKITTRFNKLDFSQSYRKTVLTDQEKHKQWLVAQKAKVAAIYAESDRQALIPDPRAWLAKNIRFI